MSDETKDQKPLPEQPDPVVNPDDETRPTSTTSNGEGGNEGEGDDPPADDPPGGDHPTKRPDDPTP